MAARELPLDRDQTVPRRRASVPWCLAAAGLLLVSAALQLVASLQRWVTFSASWTRTDRMVEDNLFDYSYPADPWENLGTAAQYFGAGYLVLSLGIVAMMRAAPQGQSALMRLLILVVAASFAIDGGHALVSGILDTPTPVQHLLVLQWLLSLVAFVCLIALGAVWLRTSWLVTLACLFLLGATVPGYLWAAFTLAPWITGYQSHDTTPWTETIVAGSTAAAGVSLLLALSGNRSDPYPARMTDFSKGDRVSWATSQGRTQGEVIEKKTSDFTFAGQTFRASADEPAFIVKSEKTDAEAAHKAGALRKLSPRKAD